MKAWLILLMIVAMTGMTAHSSFAASGSNSRPTLAQAAAMADQPVTYSADGIDIYPSTPTMDGENKYVHISKNPRDPSRYVFEACRNGLPLSLARDGLYPARRDCYHPIGDAGGYTQGEISAELQLMLQQGKSQGHSQLLSSLGSSVVSGVVVLVALNLVEAVTTGGAANVPTDAAVAAGAATDGGLAAAESGALATIGRFFAKSAIKKIAIDGSKLVVSTILGTFIGQTITNGVAQADTRKTNDNPFSSPAEMKYTANEVGNLLKSGSLVIINDNMESFETGLGAILGKIQ